MGKERRPGTKGQKLAELDKFKLDNQLSQSEDALKKSELELRDVLISQGYPADDISQVPEEAMKLAKVKSGYDQSKSQYEMSKYNAEHATLTAPFDGVVANLFSKPLQSGQYFGCILYGDRYAGDGSRFYCT